MGNQQSNIPGWGGDDEAGGTRAPVETKTCYYELLSVERDATAEEIKKAYKRKALELHPDRNYNDTERATKLFTEVQAAYEILSDPQERSWYDSHREQILRGADQPGGAGSSGEDHTIHKEHIYKFMEVVSKCKDFSDGDQSFFTLLRKLFEAIADEEIRAASEQGIDIDDAILFPAFGSSTSDYDGEVKRFYTRWLDFRTNKDFAWCDVYRLADAPDRRTRRYMEKENKKVRDEAIAEYNGDVKAFILFVRKRDPRYKPNSQTEAERQKILLQQSKEQAARARARNAEERKHYKVADWAVPNPDDIPEEFLSTDEEAEGEEEEEEESEPEIWECLVCRKVFKTEGQFSAHEMSKKHKQAVQKLKRTMQKENEDLNLSEFVGSNKKYKKSPIVKPEPTSDNDLLNDDSEAEEVPLSPPKKSKKGKKSKKQKQPSPEIDYMSEDLPSEAEESDHSMGNTTRPSMPPTPARTAYRSNAPSPSPFHTPTSPRSEASDPESDVPMETFQTRITESLAALSVSQADLEAGGSIPATPSETSTPGPKLGKAKEKRLKRQQKAEEQAKKQEEEDAKNGVGHRCAGCSAEFPSKTKLFQHLKDHPRHAKLVPVAGGGGGKAKKGKRK
ncbi:DnaJ-domain-containing protein [Ascobolus immersus RN42]|uniref:DnaJ-domain-containing protein n=1 Tax=Ascobolus immersus RN42 TaxID=1160509 RepID=A0A3N4IXR5_ASCIM|nr:DnaJ-domain-containing protein [Ascobolus immersus RN42]